MNKLDYILDIGLQRIPNEKLAFSPNCACVGAESKYKIRIYFR